jgi:hypothetical protein
MLAELAVYLRSLGRTPAEFRPHLRDAVGLWARGTRQSRAWAPHLAKARGFIDTAIDELHSRRTVVVLGSGPLFDIPLEALARNFARVVLVDLVHLATTDARVSRYGNIERQWRDLSGPDGLAFLASIADLDWVISSCLVSQLARAAAEGTERAIVDAHLDGLAALPCPVTLVTDLDYRVFNRHGVVRDSADLLFGREVPRSGIRWKWEVAPFGEEERDSRRVHYVAAWADWRRAHLPEA